ncbi:MAG: hypothetical protein KQH79_06265 [Bacteroidetes bacterium]|nr:hypothetical protein [Bacteroidota bacterium]
MFKQKTKLFAVLLGVLVISTAAIAQSEISIGRIAPGEIDFAGFELAKDGKIHIEGTGASFEKWGNNLVFYGWIVNSKSREVVWNLLDEYDREYFHGEGSFDFSADLNLKKGSYEIYYTAMFDRSGYTYYKNDFADLVQEVIRAIVEEDDYPYYKREKYFLTMSSDDSDFKVNDGKEHVNKLAEQAIASFVRTGDHETKSKSFVLKEETTINIYSLGERDGREFYDFARIYNLKTREKVWPNNSTDFDLAGGGRKNFTVFQEITLPAGDYEVKYITDGSHSFDRWNVMPPNDPQFWGITVWCDRKDMKNVSENVSVYEPVVDLTKIRDREYVSKGFELIKPMDIRVICLGEIAGGDPDDYGWIMDAKTRETVWKFSKTKSEYAGGDEKNRMVNEVISLPKGKYIAYYTSDGSHSYRDWNAAPPYDQDLWGLSLWTIHDNDQSNIKIFDEEELSNENVIVQITRVRDNEKEYKNFAIDKEMKVRVYAIGEGDDGYMYDTGWIKNMDTGKIVWEMTYRTSEHAGGAHKNRMFNNFILLEKGNYRVYYESDGSHSYRDWNDDPPIDQANYGIKIIKE